MVKLCKSCDIYKPIERFEFHWKKSGKKESRRAVCKDCRNRRKKFLDSRHGLGLHARNIKRLYNITPSQYHAIRCSQDSLCAICRKPNPTNRRFAIDHCHQTGIVRGLLCDKCNRGLGQFNDNPELIQAAFIYLMDRTRVFQILQEYSEDEPTSA